MNSIRCVVTILRLAVLVFSLAGTGQAVAASLKSEVKNQTVVDGETVLLYIIGEDLRGYPDTSALNRRFDIVGSRQQESQFVDNGKVKSLVSPFCLNFRPSILAYRIFRHSRSMALAAKKSLSK